MTDAEKGNFNRLFVYDLIPSEAEGSPVRSIKEGNPWTPLRSAQDGVNKPVGYAICFETPSILHYSYPFYDLETSDKNMGMGMMVRAIQYAKKYGKDYCYLGSAQRRGDTYKLQFKGLEWFDDKTWQTNIDLLKTILSES